MDKQNVAINHSILASILRVIKHSHCSAHQFYWGLALRTVERGFETLPFVICFYWLTTELKDTTSVPEGNPPGDSFFTLLFLLLAIFIGQLFFAYKGQKQSFMGSYRIMASYRERIIARIRCLPLAQLYQYRAGHLSDILIDDIKKIESIFTHIAADLFAAAMLPLMLFSGLLWFDWQLALSLVAGLPLALWTLNSARNYFVHIGQRKQEKFSDTAGMLVEFVSGIKTLRLFNRADVWLCKLKQRFDEIKDLSLGVEIWGAGPVVAYRFILESGLIILLLLCAVRLDSADANITWLLFFLLAHKLLGPLLEMAEYITVLRLAAQSEARVQNLFSGTLLTEPEQGISPENFDVHFDNVCFSYDSKPALLNMSFTASQNSVTAIVGPSGSGKSTLMNLLARFYDPQSGAIYLGGHDLRAVGTEHLYENVSMVFQQVQLYDSTIMQNVKIGKVEAADEEVINACKAANCHDFIVALPQGYQTQVGEAGMRLSGGERQRLSIARALLKDAPVLLLDEATASVDCDSQYELQRALSKLVENRTVIMIAHRLSTVRHASQILVLDKGELVQQGTHPDLLSQKGLYSQLWLSQRSKLVQ